MGAVVTRATERIMHRLRTESTALFGTSLPLMRKMDVLFSQSRKIGMLQGRNNGARLLVFEVL